MHSTLYFKNIAVPPPHFLLYNLNKQPNFNFFLNRDSAFSKYYKVIDHQINV